MRCARLWTAYLDPYLQDSLARRRQSASAAAGEGFTARIALGLSGRWYQAEITAALRAQLAAGDCGAARRRPRVDIVLMRCSAI